MEALSKQEIFDKVCEHLAQQKKRCVNNSSCLYRGPNGTKCAIGALIPDELYDPWMEDCGTIRGVLLEENSITEKLIVLLDSHNNMGFLRKLQDAHDMSKHLVELTNTLNALASYHKLDSSKVELITEWHYNMSSYKMVDNSASS